MNHCSVVLLNQTVESLNFNKKKFSNCSDFVLICNPSEDLYRNLMDPNCEQRNYARVQLNNANYEIRDNIEIGKRLAIWGEIIYLNRRQRLKIPSTHKKVSEPNHTVGITIHNYNYGRYLEDCLNSIFKQSYKNFYVIFSDNASDDKSWEVALKFKKRYSKKMIVIRNNRNMGPGRNLENCYANLHFDYRLEMCSDDVLHPNALKNSVKYLKKYKDVGFVMYHRHIISSENKVIKEKPFYKYSCKIEGYEQAAVYMMAAVNPSISQIIYKESAISKIKSDDKIIGRWFGARIRDFLICQSSNIVYLSEPLLYNRIHGANDSASTSNNMLEIIGPAMLNFGFAELGDVSVKRRLNESLVKLGSLSMRYALRALIDGNGF